jgi:hypothetical protein
MYVKNRYSFVRLHLASCPARPPRHRVAVPPLFSLVVFFKMQYLASQEQVSK